VARLTDVDAFAGLVVGGLLTGAAVLDNLLMDRNAGWFAALVAQPARRGRCRCRSRQWSPCNG
jgi:hypothetical protein